MKHLYLGLSFTFFFVRHDRSLRTPPNFWRHPAWNKSQKSFACSHHRPFRAKAYVIHTLLLLIGLFNGAQTNHKHKRRRMWFGCEQPFLWGERCVTSQKTAAEETSPTRTDCCFCRADADAVDFQIWYPHCWPHAWCSSERGRFELINERFSGRCDEICEPAADGLGSELFTLRLVVIWSGYVHSSGIFGLRSTMIRFWASQPCVFFQWDTTTSANSLKTLQNGLKHRETTKDTTGNQGNSVLFTEH